MSKQKFISILNPAINYQQQTKMILEGFCRLIKKQESNILKAGMTNPDKTETKQLIKAWEQKITIINKSINNLEV